MGLAAQHSAVTRVNLQPNQRTPTAKDLDFVNPSLTSTLMPAFELHIHDLAWVDSLHALQDGLKRQNLAGFQRLAGLLMVFVASMRGAARQHCQADGERAPAQLGQRFWHWINPAGN
jgi:hypothetical protein